MTVTMPLWLMALTYLVSAAAGFASCWFGVERFGAAIMGMRRPNNREATTMPNRRTPWVPIIILVASAMVVTIGVMSWLYARHNAEQDRERDAERAAQHRAQVAYDRCITKWGDDLVAGIDASRTARRGYDAATTARADATAAVLSNALGLSLDPPTATAAEVIAALRDAQRADQRVRDAAAELRDTQADNEYVAPTLACADERTTE